MITLVSKKQEICANIFCIAIQFVIFSDKIVFNSILQLQFYVEKWKRFRFDH